MKNNEKQECVLSSSICKIVLNWILRKVNNSTKGIGWKLKKDLTTLVIPIISACSLTYCRVHSEITKTNRGSKKGKDENEHKQSSYTPWHPILNPNLLTANPMKLWWNLATWAP